MMKVALGLEMSVYPHGGIEILVRNLIELLHDKVELYLVSEDTSDAIWQGKFSGMLKGHFQWDRNQWSPQLVKDLVNWTHENKIEVFHFHHATYGWDSRFWRNCAITEVNKSGVPCVSTNHGAFSIWDFIGPQRNILIKLAAFCICWPSKLRQLTHVNWEATVSQHDYHAVRDWFFPMKHKFIQIYHSILDENVIPELPKTKTILCLGTVGERKGQQYLAEAFGKIAKEFPDWTLIIAGRHAGCNTPQKMYDAIEKSGTKNQVQVLTDVPDAQARILLSEASIFAMPSLAEGLGLSLQEAMYAKAACIGSRVGGIQDLIIDGKTGILVPPTDTDTLAQGLRKLIQDEALRTKYTEAGRAHILHHNMTRNGMAQRHYELYSQVVNS